MMLTVAVDFDGVIHGYSRGWQDGELYDPPVLGAFDALRRLREDYELVIYTTRAQSEGQVARMLVWFELHGGKDLTSIPITHEKPLAVAYLDDRAIRFTSWPEALFSLRVLVPPNGRAGDDA
jgi:hypothetical protein